MKRAIIYARVSSKKQADDGLPIESQLGECRRLAESMGVIVMQEFVDAGVSGATDKRPSFQQAVDYACSVGVDYFITWSSSRFARNVDDALLYQRQLVLAHVRLKYVNSDVDAETDSGRMLNVMTMLFDEQVSRKVSADTKRSMLRAAEDGFHTGGHCPFGYTVVPEGKRHRLTPHPIDAGIVQRIFAYSLEGKGSQLIAATLNELGISQRGKPFQKNSIAYLLKNPVYCGIKLFNKTSNRLPTPESQWVRTRSHAGIVSEEDFEKVQAMTLQRTPEQGGGSPRSQFFFTGMLKCGVCGSALHTCSGTGRSKRQYHYYACRQKLQGVQKCSLSRVAAEDFDDWMLNELLDKVITPDRMHGIVRESMKFADDAIKMRENERKSMVSELRTLEKSRGNLYAILEMKGADTPDLAALSPRLNEINARIQVIELNVSKLEEQPLPLRKVTPIEAARAADMLRGMILDSRDPARVRALMASFVQGITVGHEQISIDYLPDALVTADSVVPVRSGCKWLLDLGSNQGPTD